MFKFTVLTLLVSILVMVFVLFAEAHAASLTYTSCPSGWTLVKMQRHTQTAGGRVSSSRVMYECHPPHGFRCPDEFAKKHDVKPGHFMAAHVEPGATHSCFVPLPPTHTHNQSLK